jgi:uncharacterized protein Yka (UPF0111/DUF47 family)
MALQAFVRWLLPKEDHFFDYLERQAVLAHEAAQRLVDLRAEGAPSAVIRTEVSEIEHQGDDVVRLLEEALAKTFVTPIDREDIQKLSNELDDILDFTKGAARAFVVFGVERPTPPMVDLMIKLAEGTKILANAVPCLRKGQYDELIKVSGQVRKLKGEANSVTFAALGELFRDDDVDPKRLLREREVLRDLRQAISHCEYVGSVLANLAVKNG